MTDFAIPQTLDGLEVGRWETFERYFVALQEAELTADSVQPWLMAWSQLSALVSEARSLIMIDKTLDTADSAKEQAFLEFVEQVDPHWQRADQALKERLLALDPAAPALQDIAIMLRDMRNSAELFREENVAIDTELSKLSNEYSKITGGLTADWEGETQNLSQLLAHLQNRDRAVRERASRLSSDLWLSQRDALNDLYGKMLALRHQEALNADIDNFRDYMFRAMGRFDYTPEDCFTFHEAIEQVVVPAAARVFAKKRAGLGLESLRPWDRFVDAAPAAPLTPYKGQDELIQGTLDIMQQVDPALARHVATMAEENLFDLDTRAGKALGGYCSTLSLRREPFIFMNGKGTHDDVQTMLHEAGHAFHVFEAADVVPYVWQLHAPMEFAEVASMSMELLAAPYLTQSDGGFYSDADAARARIEHLEGVITFLPYMAVVDAFQHWVYTHPAEAANSAQCDAKWDELWTRFMSGVDWTGLDDERVTGWHRKLHIFQVPFYYIEYGMAQIGALQVWRNALTDQAGAVASYRKALALGGTRPLPELFEAAGAEFRFDTDMLSDMFAFIEQTIAELEPLAATAT